MFTRHFTASADDIDTLGHVNNAVWVRWAQEIAVTHWQIRADPVHVAAFVWVIVRHEIDYFGNIGLGETVEARTEVVGEPQGARFDRLVEFHRPQALGAVLRPLVRVLTRWAMLDRESGRLVRVRADIVAPFLAERNVQ